MKKTIITIAISSVFMLSLIICVFLFKKNIQITENESITTDFSAPVLYESTEGPASFMETQTEKEIYINKDGISYLIRNMTPEEKIGQLFIIRPQVLDYSYYSVSDGTKARYCQYPAGGFVLFSNNIEGPEQLSEFTNDLHELSDKIPVLISIDEEGGSITRIASSDRFDVEIFDDMETIAQNGNENDAEHVGTAIGNYLRQYGVDLDFAPVADVNTNPDNPVIGSRAFGSDPDKAGKMVAAAVKGFHASEEMCCLKHFPGHGDTNSDTHTGFAETQKNWEELKSCEKIPFIEGIKNEADMVMAAHIAVPNITGNDEPASLSYEILTNKLRKELGFEGVIITDSMEMGAVADRYNSAEAAVRAFTAGADIILMPENYDDAFNGMLDAYNNGVFSEERLDTSLRRILKLKLKYKNNKAA